MKIFLFLYSGRVLSEFFIKRLWLRLGYFLFGNPWRPFLLGIILLIVAPNMHFGIDTEWLKVSEETIHHLIRDIGISFIVGAIIASGIERVANYERDKHHEKQMSAIKLGVLQAVLERAFPREYIDYLLEVLEGESFFNENVAIDVRLSYLDKDISQSSEQENILVEIKYIHQVTNIKTEVETYEPELFVEKNWDWPNHKDLIGVKYWSVGSYILDDKQIQDADRKAEDEPYHIWYKFPHKVDIEPHETVSVLTVFNLVKSARDTSTWTFMRPCNGAKVYVTSPEDLEVYITAKHPKHRDAPLANENGKTFAKVEINDPLFPFTVVEISWRKSAEDIALIEDKKGSSFSQKEKE